MPQSQPLLALSTSTIHAVDNGTIPPLSPLTPIGGDGDAGGGPGEHCAQTKTQTVLPLQLTETRQARIERIAALLNGPVSGKVQTASVYFNAAGERHANQVAQRDQFEASTSTPSHQCR
jgi:hypothetical protein